MSAPGPPGVDPDPYSRGDGWALREHLGLGVGPVAIVVANFLHYEGPRYFFEAWAGVCGEFENACALLVGDGLLREAGEARAREPGLAEHVRFLGTRRDVPALLAAADLLVHPWLEEGFSNAILEAMAAGRPVVATNVGGNPEAVCDGAYRLPRSLARQRRPGGRQAACVPQPRSRPLHGRGGAGTGVRTLSDTYDN